ncbi:MAG: type II toxin-antitoxin system Phd/YefM family antitoxin [Spirochaetes bacterium]|nr:type II toxin-antitoxin system Phd/YefM family antitoxin [Spirochaetota bacterium]
MKTINIHEAKTTLSKVLSEIEKNNEVYVICKNGKPIADLVPHVSRSRTQSHSIMSDIAINYNPTEPLDENEWGEIE